MRLLVCGGRDWKDMESIKNALDMLLNDGISVVIHGGAKGADDLAGWWCRRCGIIPVLRDAAFSRPA